MDRSHKFNNKISLLSATKALPTLKPLTSIRFAVKRSLSKLIHVMLNYKRLGKCMIIKPAKCFNFCKFKSSRHHSLVLSYFYTFRPLI